MESRQDILAAVRRNRPPEAPHPPLDDGGWVRYEDRLERFTEALEAVGGRCVTAKGVEQLNERLAQLPAYAQADKVCSCVEAVGRRDVVLDAVVDPHELEDIDFAILSGEFGVAENGAVWMTDAALRHRAICFIPQHLAVVIRAGADANDVLVDNMHEAYKRISFSGSGFGLFMSGPSKTADIEQSLVIGAHGPRSLTVFVEVDL